mmetsp:Transcript_58047/g.127217  ORF Transcript_58047/g.127217 Transcript_58047/m.127217 type:complete len:146 (-) Transcript_58047:238-675(-)
MRTFVIAFLLVISNGLSHFGMEEDEEATKYDGMLAGAAESQARMEHHAKISRFDMPTCKELYEIMVTTPATPPNQWSPIVKYMTSKAKCVLSSVAPDECKAQVMVRSGAEVSCAFEEGQGKCICVYVLQGGEELVAQGGVTEQRV